MSITPLNAAYPLQSQRPNEIAPFAAGGIVDGRGVALSLLLW